MRPGVSEERQVVPRWRSFANTVSTGELDSLQMASREARSAELSLLRDTQASSPSLYAAADLLSALISDEQHGPESDALMDYVAANHALPATLAALHRELRTPKEASQSDQGNGHTVLQAGVGAVISAVQGARRRLQAQPRNAVTWVDLALAHATLGSDKRAVRAMETAIALAPNSRFVLRAASRLFVHMEEPGKANYILNSTPRVHVDPWLLAAEMSTAQLANGRFSNVRAARELLSSENFRPLALSELASELATGEVQAGRDRRARMLFEQAFIEPTENAVAQAAALAELSDLRLHPSLLQVERGFEARAISHARLGEWTAATAEAFSWQIDQPFALEPILYGTYTASLGSSDFASAIELAYRGLRAHPLDPMLNNNAAL